MEAHKHPHANASHGPEVTFSSVGEKGGCRGRNEICNTSEAPCKGIQSYEECAELCAKDVACVSFEQSPSGECSLSTTCTAAYNNIDVPTNWSLHVPNKGEC